MADVIIDESSLNAIANSIRMKNGLVRTYKPSEMALAIRALRDNVPSTHGYTVRIEQSSHQTIYVDLYQDNQTQTYQQSFTVGEPLWRFQARIEAEAGYQAGTLNYSGTYAINRDYIISASPAIYIGENITTVYMNGNVSTAISHDPYYRMYSNSSCTTEASRSGLYGIVNIVDVSNGYPYSGEGLIGGGVNVPIIQASEIRQNIDVSKKRNLSRAIQNCTYLKKIDLSQWSLTEVETLYYFSQGSHIQYFGDISHWYMPELTSANFAFSGNTKLESLNLHDWYCPKLERCEQMFGGDDKLRYVDISGLSTNSTATSNFITSTDMFKNCSSLQYIIMDREEVMFSGSGTLFVNPNNRVKYLVPQEYVEAYKTHSNWSSRASQIDAIENYTIDRYNGQVFVHENV